jgi:predicted metal-dependent hydrolase
MAATSSSPVACSPAVQLDRLDPPFGDPVAAKHAFKTRVRAWAQTLDVPLVWLAVRPMRHKWASCSSNSHLHFSTDLLLLDPALWDYVIVHELLHLTIPNHGRLWKALMRAHLGDWESAAARLQCATIRAPRRNMASAD